MLGKRHLYIRKIVIKSLETIIPAAGNSRRFKFKRSKIFYKFKKKTLIEITLDKVCDFSKKIHLIIKRNDLLDLKKILYKKKYFKKINFIIQNKQDGMATAILLGLKHVKSKKFFTIWSDQIYVTKKTIQKTIYNHFNQGNILTFPTCYQNKPYTKVIYKKKKIIDILHSRDGHEFKNGYSDCGIFCGNTLFFNNHLKKLIKSKNILTKETKEYDFLNSFKFIKKKSRIKSFEIKNKLESKGINFLHDIKFKKS